MATKPKLKLLKTRKDFIEFFEKIPNKKWCKGAFHDKRGRSCAVGHLDKFVSKQVVGLGFKKYTKEFDKLHRAMFIKILTNLGKAYKASDYTAAKHILFNVNDKFDPHFKQKSTKARVIAFLKQ